MNLSKHRFLYVEDDLLSCEIMQMMLVSVLGAGELKTYNDSVDFIARLDSLNYIPDLVMLDIHVKPYDGFTMLHMLRETPKFAKVRVIALTASVMNEEVERLRASGFDGAIAKPLSIQTFPDLIARVLRGESVWHIA